MTLILEPTAAIRWHPSLKLDAFSAIPAGCAPVDDSPMPAYGSPQPRSVRDVLAMSRVPDFDRQTIVAQLRAAAVSDPEALAELAQPVQHIVARRSELSTLPIGASRFGGSPDVPDGFDWPTHRGRFLTFLAQLDLNEFESESLPKSGWLLFFYDDAEQPWGYDLLHAGGARVFYFDASRDALRRIEHPDVLDAGGPCACCSLVITAGVHLPEPQDLLVTNRGFLQQQAERDRYCGIAEQLRCNATGEPEHQFLGHPRLIQGDMRAQCSLVEKGVYCGEPRAAEGKRTAELLEDASNWLLLLGLDTDERGPDWHWGESGRIYYFIRREDLARRAFDRAWLILQSG